MFNSPFKSGTTKARNLTACQEYEKELANRAAEIENNFYHEVKRLYPDLADSRMMNHDAFSGLMDSHRAMVKNIFEWSEGVIYLCIACREPPMKEVTERNIKRRLDAYYEFELPKMQELAKVLNEGANH